MFDGNDVSICLDFCPIRRCELHISRQFFFFLWIFLKRKKILLIIERKDVKEKGETK